MKLLSDEKAIELYNALSDNDIKLLEDYGLDKKEQENDGFYGKVIELIGKERIVEFILATKDINIWEYLQPSEKKEKLEILIEQCDISNEKDRSVLMQIWRETDEEVKIDLDYDIYTKLIESMKYDSKRLANIWKSTPEVSQVRNSHLLNKILKYTIHDTKKYISIWENTSYEVQKQYEDISNKLKILNQLQTVNNRVIDTIDLRILDSKYTSTLSIQQLQMITCYPEEQKRILGLTDGEYNVINNVLNNVKDMQQWKYEYSAVVSNIGNYGGLVQDIIEMQNNDNIDIDYYKILMIIHQKNYFNVQNYQDVEKLDEVKIRLFEAIKNDNVEVLDEYPEISKLSSIDRKKLIVLENLYNMDIKNAEVLIKRYGQDILELADSDENLTIKEIISNIQGILMAKDENEISTFFEEQSKGKSNIDNINLEIKLKSAYAEEYNKELTEVNDLQEVTEEEKELVELQGINVYDAGIDFNLMITSIAPYNSNFPKDFYKDWNRQETQSQGFCCSYIRNDMLGHAPVPHLCYGFSNMSKESLILSSVDDMGSNTSNGIVEETAYDNVRFYAPNNQINKVYDESGYQFNEMVYNRIQNGEKKQPDYIVAFRKDGKISNIKTIKKAVEQFKENGIEIPVVIVDEDKCIKNEKEKLYDMVNAFKLEPSEELFLKIQQKAKNNSVANQLVFNEFSNYIFNDYKCMRRIVIEKKNNPEIEENETSIWMERCRHWYEVPSKLPEEIKAKFLQIKNNVAQVIKAKIRKMERDRENITKERGEG